jgi:P27 family predicted phage terminase small subunit
VAGRLVEAGLLTPLDRPVLALYCQAWEWFVEASQRLHEQGPLVGSDASPWFQVATQAMEQVRSLAGELGLTPASRARMGITLSGPEPGDG